LPDVADKAKANKANEAKTYEVNFCHFGASNKANVAKEVKANTINKIIAVNEAILIDKVIAVDEAILINKAIVANKAKANRPFDFIVDACMVAATGVLPGVVVFALTFAAAAVAVAALMFGGGGGEVCDIIALLGENRV
jgi:hypothetical protein